MNGVADPALLLRGADVWLLVDFVKLYKLIGVDGAVDGFVEYKQWVSVVECAKFVG